MTVLNHQSKTCLPSLKLLGDYWTLRIIDAISDCELHFCDLQRHVDNLNPVTLTDRLKKLEEAKLIKRDESSKTKVSYRLTKLGVDILPVLDAINTFSNKAKNLN
jgi:DNA-binding HxlR family transcriptional regulator